MNEAGEVTSHLQGLFYRTVRMLEAGLKPIYVFDGKPPTMKRAELAKRSDKRGDAEADLAAAKEAGDADAVAKFAKRTVKVTPTHNAECKRLLTLLGVPVVDAPSEAEAQCAEIVKAGAAYALATEDMDALTFGAPRVLRHLMAPAAQDVPVHEYAYEGVLAGLGLTPAQFVDVCILCGCDYCGTIRGVGPQRALDLIKKHGTIEAALATLDPAKYPVPDPFPYDDARRLFTHPEVTPVAALPPFKWTPPDVDGAVDFLVREKGFNEDRVRKALARVAASGHKATQGRLETFFGPAKTVSSNVGAKRPAPGAKGKGGAAGGIKKPKGKAGGVSRK